MGEPEGRHRSIVDREQEEGERVLREHHLCLIEEASLSEDKDTLSGTSSPGLLCRPGFPRVRWECRRWPARALRSAVRGRTHPPVLRGYFT